MTEHAAPQSASETPPRSVQPRIGTPDHLINSDTVVAVNPFASPAVKESISFDRALCEFLRLHFHVHEPKAREWMSTADAKDSEALRFSKAVHQAENAHWNQVGQFRRHFAVWHADPLYMRAYEAWPDLSMHERYSRLKMALGPVSTPFNFTGTIDEAIAALDKFILTGEIPKPAPPSPALVAACKNDEISRRSAALEKAFEKPAVVHGPVKVAAMVSKTAETIVPVSDKSDADEWFGEKKVADKIQEHWSAGGSFRIQERKIKGSQRESAMMSTDDWNAWLHKIFEVESLTELDMVESVAVEVLKNEHAIKFKAKAIENATEKPASAPIASTPAVEPAKPAEPIAPKITPVESKPNETVLIGEIVPEPLRPLQLVQPTNEIVLFDPRRSLDYVMQAHDLITTMISKKILIESGKDENGDEIDGDYGKIAGSKKPALFKSGAEKLCEAFGLRPEFVTLPTAVSDWKEPFFYFHYKCELYRVSDGKLIATANGSCNSKEDKYGWRWLDLEKVPRKYRDTIIDLETRGGRISEFDFAVEKAETTGKHGKAESYWKQFTEAIANGSAKNVDKKDSKGVSRKAWEIDAMQYRVPNSDIFSIVNTLDKMAQKRALVGAVLIGTAASRFFTQDIEDMPDFGTIAA